MNVVTEYIFAQRRHIHGQQVLEKGLDTSKHHEMQIKIPPHTYENCWCCSVTKFCLTLWPHWLQHDKLLHSPLCPRVCSNTCPLKWRCYLTISSSAAPFSFSLQSAPASGFFCSESVLHVRWPKYWNFSFSISPFMNIQSWFPSGLIDLISLLSKELSRVFSSTTIRKHQIFGAQPSLWFSGKETTCQCSCYRRCRFDSWVRRSPGIVQSLTCVWLFVTPWTAAYQAFLPITISQAHSNSCPSRQWCHLGI